MTDEIRDELERVADDLMQPQSHMEVGLDHYSPAREKQRVVAILAVARRKWRNEGIEAMREEVSAAKELSREAATEGRFYLGKFLRDYADACASRLKE